MDAGLRRRAARRAHSREVPRSTAAMAGSGGGTPPHPGRRRRALDEPVRRAGPICSPASSRSSSTTRRSRTCSPGLFVGPTSQAPRVDEARHDAALRAGDRAGARLRARGRAPPPWLGDLLFRHLLVDVTGNTHRAEISHRQAVRPGDAARPPGAGRAARLRDAARTRAWPSRRCCWCARSWPPSRREPYQRAARAAGASALHDRFLLPHWMWRDFEDVLAYLGRPRPAPCRPTPTAPSSSCAARWWAARRPATSRSRSATPSSPGTCSARSATAAGTVALRRLVDGADRGAGRRPGPRAPRRCWSTARRCRCAPASAPGECVARRAVPGLGPAAQPPRPPRDPPPAPHRRARYAGRGARSARAPTTSGTPRGGASRGPPLTRFEAAARRSQRFTRGQQSPFPIVAGPARGQPDTPYTVDLRKRGGDRPMPSESDDEPAPEPRIEANQVIAWPGSTPRRRG